MEDRWILGLLSSLMNVGAFVIGAWLVPKAVAQWQSWKKGGKPAHLSACVALGWASLCLLCGVFFRFVKSFG
jgi:hypothetical protein